MTAYSITYIYGLITIVIVTSQLFPLFLRVNLREEADKLWLEMGGRVETDGQSAAPTIVGRGYRVDASAGYTVAAIQQRLGQQSSIVRVQRHGRLLALTPELKLRRDDRVLLVGYRGSLIETAAMLGLPMPYDNNSVRYYHLLDLEELAEQMYDAEFVKWMLGQLKPNQALFRLAE